MLRDSWFCGERPARTSAPLILVGLWSGLAVTRADAQLDYHADVAPILRDYCVGCHNESDYEAEFSVETYRSLMAGSENGEVIVPGKANESTLMRVLHREVKPYMPPKREPQPEAAMIALIRRWIEEGAAGPEPAEDASILSTVTVPEIVPVEGIRKAITAAALSPDRDRLAIAGYGEVTVVRTGDRVVLNRLEDLDGKVNAVHFSPDGERLVAATGVAGLKGSAVIWELGESGKRTEIGNHRDILFDAEFSPDGEHLATAGYDRIIRIWDIESAQLAREIEGHNGAIFDLAFSPDGTLLASASADETAKIWKVSSGERLDTLNQPQGEQYRVAFTPDGDRIVAAGADNRIRLWQLLSKDTPQINPLKEARFGHEDEIVELALGSKGDWVATGSADGTIKLWTLPALAPAGVFPDQPDLVSSLIELDESTLLATRLDGSETIYPISSAPAAERDQRAWTLPGTAVVSDATDGQEVTLTQIEEDADLNSPQDVPLPAQISGRIEVNSDVDTYRFSAKRDEAWVLEVDASRSKSPLDSTIEVLTAEGQPIERVVLRAIRDSWFTFRGKDSMTSDDFRLQNWREMELNEYLYANGEVVRLWLYPRGPDSGFRVYPGVGLRHTYFGTTALSHALGAPCYIVQPLPPGSVPDPNGLPVYRVFYENDDDPERELGSDSRLFFTAPYNGECLARVGDVRGFGGPDFTYRLTIRPQRPDFAIAVEGKNPVISPGSGKEIGFTVDRIDGFQGEIRIDISELPSGVTASTPIVIEAGQHKAFAVIVAEADAALPENATGILTATAQIGDRKVEKPLGDLGKIALGAPPKILVSIEPDDPAHVEVNDGQPLTFVVHPGKTITALVKTTRLDYEGSISLGGDDSGRNLPHGVFVDNIGLNGLLIVEGQDRRQFFITAAPWVPVTERWFFLKAAEDGQQASRPARLRVAARP